MKYDERKLKNYRCSTKKIQEKPLGGAVTSYYVDLIYSFELYFSHYPDGIKELFMQSMDDSRLMQWYSRKPVGISLGLLFKQVCS